MVTPEQNISEGQKNEKYHLDMLNGFVRQAYNNPLMQQERLKDHNNYLLANGHFDPKQYRYMTDIGTKTNPARFVNHPLVMRNLDLLGGEISAQELQFYVNVVNKNGITRKMDQRMLVAGEFVMRPLRREMEKELGVSFDDPEVNQEMPEDIEAFMKTPFRTGTEEMVRIGLNYLIPKYSWKETFRRGFNDLGVCCKEFYRVFIRNGDPYVKRKDPRSMLYDPHSDVENIADARFCGDENFLTIPEIVEEYNPDDAFMSYLWELEKQTDSKYFDDYNREIGYQCFMYEPNKALKICVTRMEWRDIKKLKYKTTPNPYDDSTPYIKKVKKDEKVTRKGEKLIQKRVVQIRYAVKIGEKLLDWGVLDEDIIRSEQNYSNARMTYHGAIKNNFNGSTLSVVDVLSNIQEEYNIVKYNIRLTMARAGGKSVVYDTSQIPKGWSFDDVSYHLKNSGLAGMNMKAEGNQLHNFNQFQQIDLTLSNSLTQLMNYALMLEESASKLTGLSDARAGITKPGDAVGVNNNNIMQSSLITAPLFDLHYRLIGDVMHAAGNLIPKCGWAESEKMLPVYGDTMFQMLKITKDICLDEYGIFVQNNSKGSENKKVMLSLIQTYAANGSIDSVTAIKAVNAESATEIEIMATKALEAIKENQLAMEERKVAAQEEANKINMMKVSAPTDVAKINAASAEKVAEITGRWKAEISKAGTVHNEDMQEIEHKNELDKLMLESTNEEAQEPIKPVKPKVPAKKPVAVAAK